MRTPRISELPMLAPFFVLLGIEQSDLPDIIPDDPADQTWMRPLAERVAAQWFPDGNSETTV